jgi:hypothetical protein
MSENVPKTIILTIINSLKENPYSYSMQISNYLPLLYDYLQAYIVKDKIVFTYFKKSLIDSWTSIMRDIPQPDLEGVFDLETLITKLMEHTMKYEKQVMKLAKLDGITSSLERRNALRDLLNKVIYQSVLDTLMILVPL